MWSINLVTKVVELQKAEYISEIKVRVVSIRLKFKMFTFQKQQINTAFT